MFVHCFYKSFYIYIFNWSRGYRGRSRGGYNRDANSRSGANRSNEKWYQITVPFGALLAKEDLFTLISDNIAGKFDPQRVSSCLLLKKHFLHLTKPHKIPY